MRSADFLSDRPSSRGVPPERGAEWTPRAQWLAPVPLEDAMSAPTARAEVVYAYANHARWVVDCPTCNGAQLACRTDKRFMCNECANVAVGGRWRVVEWPADADEIERLLDRRPDVARNWFPGETVRQLKDENRIHGVGV